MFKFSQAHLFFKNHMQRHSFIFFLWKWFHIFTIGSPFAFCYGPFPLWFLWCPSAFCLNPSLCIIVNILNYYNQWFLSTWFSTFFSVKGFDLNGTNIVLSFYVDTINFTLLAILGAFREVIISLQSSKSLKGVQRNWQIVFINNYERTKKNKEPFKVLTR